MNTTRRKNIITTICFFLALLLILLAVQQIRFQNAVNAQAKRAYGIYPQYKISDSIEGVLKGELSDLINITARLMYSVEPTYIFCQNYAAAMNQFFRTGKMTGRNGEVLRIPDDFAQCGRAMTNMMMAYSNLQDFSGGLVRKTTEISDPKIRAALEKTWEQAKLLDQRIEESNLPESPQTREDVVTYLLFFFHADDIAEEFYQATQELMQEVRK